MKNNDQLIREKIKNIGGIDYSDDYSNEIITNIESIIPDYLSYVLNKYGGSYFTKDVVATGLNQLPVSSKSILSLGFFINYSDEQTLYDLQELDDRFFKTVVPFIEGLPSDYILIGIKDDYLGKIFYWNHESDMYDELYLIYDNFKEFTESLEIEKPFEDDREVISIRLDF